jgi:hypothetical protein
MHRMLLMCLAMMLIWPASASAAPRLADTCFAETGYCITGRLEQFWRTNGGLAVFGLPLTAASKQTAEDGRQYLTQWFERARFEYHPHDDRPYDVHLGHLGVKILEAQGRDWYDFPKADPASPHYFDTTGQAIAPEFWAYWSSHGIELGDAQTKTIPESLALFGYPISPMLDEQNADGSISKVQWFERARFEYHPELEAQYRVLVSHLGRQAFEITSYVPPPPAEVLGLPGVPPVQGACAQNAPYAVEGAQAWMTEYEHDVSNEPTSVCVRLVLNGQAVKDAKVKMTLHYRTRDVRYGPIKTGEDGVAEQGFYIGGRSLAQRNYTVNIDITVTAPNGDVYTTTTSFTPRYPKEN